MHSFACCLQGHIDVIPQSLAGLVEAGKCWLLGRAGLDIPISGGDPDIVQEARAEPDASNVGKPSIATRLERRTEVVTVRPPQFGSTDADMQKEGFHVEFNSVAE